MFARGAIVIQVYFNLVTVGEVKSQRRVKQAGVKVWVLLADLFRCEPLQMSRSHLVNRDAGASQAGPPLPVTGARHQQGTNFLGRFQNHGTSLTNLVPEHLGLGAMPAPGFPLAGACRRQLALSGHLNGFGAPLVHPAAPPRATSG